MPRKRKAKLELGRDYVMNDQHRAVFTRQYLLKRGDCCGHDCPLCPYPQGAGCNLAAGNGNGLAVAELTISRR